MGDVDRARLGPRPVAPEGVLTAGLSPGAPTRPGPRGTHRCHASPWCTWAASAAPGPRWSSACSVPLPGWVNVGELVDLARSVAPADELCGCGVPFSQCPMWTQVGEVAFKGWTEDVLDRLSALHRAAARQRHLPGLLGSRRTPSARAGRPALGVHPHLPGRRRGDGQPGGRRRLQGTGPRAGPRRRPRHRPAHAQRRPRPARGGVVLEPSTSTDRTPPPAVSRCGGSPPTAPRRSGARSRSRWPRSSGSAAPGPRGCATRTSSPTRSASLVDATATARRPAVRRRPARRRGRPGGARPEPRPVRQPGPVPLRPARAPPRRRLDHRDARRPTGPS